jgi:hypothetical protein
VLTPEDYRQLAERCALLAFECATPGVAEELRTLALEYLTRAVSPMTKRMTFSKSGTFADIARPVPYTQPDS